jgi:hypothetical protein
MQLKNAEEELAAVKFIASISYDENAFDYPGRFRKVKS